VRYTEQAGYVMYFISLRFIAAINTGYHFTQAPMGNTGKDRKTQQIA